MSKLRLLVYLMAAIGLSMPVYAQINPFRGSSGTPLTSADLTALTDATNRLLNRPDLAVGDSETWSNAQSGASGAVTAGAAVQRKGMACRVVSYKNKVPGPRPERGATLTWCKTGDGWKVG